METYDSENIGIENGTKKPVNKKLWLSLLIIAIALVLTLYFVFWAGNDDKEVNQLAKLLASEETTIQDCLSASETGTKLFCLKGVMSIKKDYNIEYCKGIDNDPLEKKFFYKQLPNRILGFEYLPPIAINAETDCLFVVARATLSPDVCEAMNEQEEVKDVCKNLVSALEKNKNNPFFLDFDVENSLINQGEI